MWTLRSVIGKSEPYNTSELFGTKVTVTFLISYKQAKGKKEFVELPLLEWGETIMMNEHHKKETWEFKTNMYKHNPGSKTLVIWTQRYIAAYEHAYGLSYTGKGYAKILDKNGAPLKRGKLKKGITDKLKMAEEVKKYLRKKGGILEIEIVDIPSIRKPKETADTIKERLLNFDCGLTGLPAPRYKAQQYLKVSAKVPESEWLREFKKDWPRSLEKEGLTIVSTPESVSHIRVPCFSLGECW